MEILLEIKDKPWPSDLSSLKIREASRAIIFDENNLIPLLFVGKYNYHKLPGGGIKAGEDKLQALVREIKEETGSSFIITGEVGMIIEYRSGFDLKQISYCYLGKIISKEEPNFTEKELNEKFKLVWLSLDDAISTIKNDKPENYEGPLIKERDLKFLETAKQIMKKL